MEETGGFLESDSIDVVPKTNRCTLKDCQVTCQLVNESEIVNEVQRLDLEVRS